MNLLLPFLTIIPLIGMLVSIFTPKNDEKAISAVAFFTTVSHLVLTFIILGVWVWFGFAQINIKEIVIYRAPGYEFFIDFYFDALSAVYVLTGSLLTFLITVYSIDYLHLEKGYKRFFNAMLLFFLGYNLVVIAGNFETMFIGWEMLGISSFMLIAFYRERYLPVKNAMKVFSIYRIGDVGIVLTMWLSHHFWHENITFLKLCNETLVHEHLVTQSWQGVLISLFILIAAIVKSAQFPFSTWLARAMEGPSSSSAIFYGSLSVHMGAFLLTRTFEFWHAQTVVRFIIGIVGVLTVLVASPIARVQPSIKGQIAYSATVQIGLIFVEIALGLRYLAMLHFMGNAFLRTYQLLVSPSVVAYLIREQHYSHIHREKSLEASLPKKIRYTFYIWSIKEWYLDSTMYMLLWRPFKMIGRKLHFLSAWWAVWTMMVIYGAARFWLYWVDVSQIKIWGYFASIAVAIVALLVLTRAFTERKNALLAWALIAVSHFWRDLSVSFNEIFSPTDSLLYLSGIVVSTVIGAACLLRLAYHEQTSQLDMQAYYGHSEKHDLLNLTFLLSTLGMAGFPITTAFLGKDLILNHIHHEQYILVALIAVSFVLDGVAALRIYTRLFLGSNSYKFFPQPQKTNILSKV